MPSALIASVGGTPDPVAFTLREHRPDFVCFLASQRSIDLVGQIKSAAGLPIQDEKVLVDDADDLLACYRAALECVGRVRAHGFSLDDTAVDYTGGTKAMTAALAMAAVARGMRFSYVGGTDRDSEGLGRVKPGCERIQIDASPWRVFALEEKRRIAQYFNTHQYAAAALGLEELQGRVPEPECSLLEPLRDAARGYAAWDRFDHSAALPLLRSASERLRERTRAAATPAYDEFIEHLRDGVRTLGELKGRTRDFQRKHPLLVGDLLANAERRMEQGKFDDAVARLYRALELLAQCAFEQAIGVETARVPIAKLPEALRAEFARRYADGQPEAKLPMSATYHVLAEIGDPLGRRFVEQGDQVRKILDARNSSILAHGTRPVTEPTARRLRDIIHAFLPPSAIAPRFPRLPW